MHSEKEIEREIELEAERENGRQREKERENREMAERMLIHETNRLPLLLLLGP